MNALLLLHAAATWFMGGLIWFVQVVHYPLFDRVSDAGFSEYERVHTRRTAWVVLPPMLVELGCALLLFVWRPAGVAPSLLWLGIGLLLLIWFCTAVVQVPQHRALQRGFEPEVHKRLVVSNWVRTAGWSLRGLLALWMLGQMN